MHKGKLIFIVLFLIANGYGILCGGLYFFQESMLFHPTQLPQDYTFTFKTNFIEITNKTQDGANLHGLYFTVDNPKGTLLYYHGNAGDVSKWGEVVQYFVEKDLNVVVMDYRNFGKSTGAMSETALYEDANFWYAFARDAAQKTNTPLHIYGRSLGTTFATYVASKNEAEQLILETPFYSIENEAKSRFSILPISQLLKYKMRTHSYINKVKAPITMLHGTEDRVVKYAHGKKLYDVIEGNTKRFVTISGGNHHNLGTHLKYHQTIDSLLGTK